MISTLSRGRTRRSVFAHLTPPNPPPKITIRFLSIISRHAQNHVHCRLNSHTRTLNALFRGNRKFDGQTSQVDAAGGLGISDFTFEIPDRTEYLTAKIAWITE